MSNAILTANTTLSYKASSTYTKLVDIINYPDMGAAPSKIDTTTLSATKVKTYILGLQEAPELTFEANYNKTDYDAIVALESSKHTFKLEFGDTGTDGTFFWAGEVSVFVTGGGVDEARKMTITCSAETEIGTSEPSNP